MINDLKKETKINSSKQNLNQSQNLFDTHSFIQKFLNESKNANLSKKIEQFKQPILFDDSEYESYSFRPEINQKSKDLLKKKFKKRKNSSPLNKKEINNFSNNSYIENRRLNTPISELLYEDASNKRQKLENICINEKMNIKKDGNQSLISKGSVNLLLKKNEIKLNEIIEKYSKNNDDGKLSITNTIQCLWEIHILRELLKNSSKNIEEINLEYIKNIIEEYTHKNGKGTREIEEIEFIEQLWIKINPNYETEKDYIEKGILKNFLKLLFSLNEQTEINKMITTVNNYLKNIKKKNKEINDNNSENNIENNNNLENNQIKEKNNDNEENNEIKNNINNKKYKSLLRDKEYEKQEIWSISKFIRVFFELKKLISTYQNTKREKIMEDIIKEREKELTFQPDFNATASYFRKKNKNDKNEDIKDIHNTSINSNISNKKKHDFNKLYEEFMLKKQMHEKALMILRENKERREIRMCTDRPKINKDYKIKNRKKTPEVGCTRNEFLYNLNKDIINNRKQKILEMENEYKEKYSFRPNITNNAILMNKSFVDGPKHKPKGSEAYIKRNRSVIQFRKREKNNLQNKIIGSNYEKVINQKINLPRIKDLEPSTNLMQQNEIQKKENKENNINDNSTNNNIENNNNSNDEDIYFTIQVKTSKGRIKPLKIYINNNPIETANKFCDENNIKKSTRDKIIQKIKELKKVYQEIGDQEDKK